MGMYIPYYLLADPPLYYLGIMCWERVFGAVLYGKKKKDAPPDQFSMH